MSDHSNFISDEHSTENDNTVAIYNPLGEYPSYALYYVSSMFVNVRELKSNVGTEHQHEKHGLIQLNERLRFFVDSVHQLELQNEKYITKLADLRRQSFSTSIFDTKFNERHVHIHNNLVTVHCGKIDCDFEFELFQMQGEIYKQLIHITEESNHDQRSKLQQELEQSAITLGNMRKTYSESQRMLESLHIEREDIFRQYLKATSSWGHWRKQVNELKVIVQSLKNRRVFYSEIRSHAEDDACSIEALDMKQFWASKWEKIVANIRRDYELLYASIHHETVIYYKEKMEEVQVLAQQAVTEQTNHYQLVEIKKLEMVQQTLLLEHEEAQRMYAYEKEVLTKFEIMTAKLESDFESLQHQQCERFEQQSKDLHNLQEQVMTTVESIEEMRRKKISLEGEIIVYRRLLELDEQEKWAVVDSTPIVHSTSMRTFAVERQEIASIGIECPLDSTYISLVNHSTSKDIDISGWVLRRHIDSKSELKYTLPNATRLPAGGELRIYSKLGADAAQVYPNYEFDSHHLLQKLVTNNVISWIIGDRTVTRLFNQHGEEKATCVQTAASE